MHNIPNDPVLEKVLNSIERIYFAYKEWRPLQAKADTAAYDILGMIFELAAEIDSDATGRKRGILEKDVAKSVQFEGGKRWSAGGKATTELLATELFGVKANRSRKHNWTTVLAYAHEHGVDPTKQGFVDWVSAFPGGIEGVLDEVRGVDRAGESASVEELTVQVADCGEHPVIDSPIKGIGKTTSILVVRKNAEEKIEILRTESSEAKVRKVLADLVGTSRTKKLTEAGIVKAERQALRAMLTVTLHSFEGLSLRHKHILRFRKAREKLRAIPQLMEKHFDENLLAEGATDISTIDEDTLKKEPAIIDIQNPDYHPLDPGRFIKSAKRGSLLPVDIFGKTGTEAKVAIREYLEETKPFKFPSREPSQGGGATLEKHFEELEPTE